MTGESDRINPSAVNGQITNVIPVAHQDDRGGRTDPDRKKRKKPSTAEGSKTQPKKETASDEVVAGGEPPSAQGDQHEVDYLA
jgi:hypothetical protein